ncbi:hypothetical protein ACT8ZV_17415 [Nocardioides sp. MAHUQ-72]|uniref:hypothetical protein n=1 Tax=unclassified Nocardioides TaxID=2615069 RepID=UPI00361DCE70
MSVRVSAAMLVSSAALLVGSVLVSGGPHASGAGPDNTPPTLRVTPQFEVGGQVTRLGGYVCDDEGEFTRVPYLVKYSASDPSGVQRFNRWEIDGEGEPGSSFFWPSYEDDPWRDTLTDYRAECGGGIPEPSGWAVTAYDGADNAKYVASGVAQPHVYQQNGVSGALEPDSVPMTRTGTWTTSSCTCASGGSQMSTTQAGATATYTMTARAGGAELALVMAQGPGRGSFQVRVDDTLVATVDSRAATNRNRVIVWRGRVAAGNHTLAVRNLATTGRPRIDVDAVLSHS